MILGINWYREFPVGLYNYKYFEFRRSPGGFADWPSELFTSILVGDNQELISAIEQLIQSHSQARIFIKQNENYFYLKVGWYHLYDYDFLLVLEIEKILRELNALKIVDFDFKNCVLIKLGNHELYNRHYYPKIEGLTSVHSEMGKHNALTNALRIDCHLSNSKVEGFLSEVKLIANECKVYTIYYSKFEMPDITNLYVFLTNGRQGLGLKEMIVTDGKLLEEKLKAIFNIFDVENNQYGDSWKSPTREISIIDVQNKDYHRLLND